MIAETGGGIRIVDEAARGVHLASGEIVLLPVEESGETETAEEDSVETDAEGVVVIGHVAESETVVVGLDHAVADAGIDTAKHEVEVSIAGETCGGGVAGCEDFVPPGIATGDLGDDFCFVDIGTLGGILPCGDACLDGSLANVPYMIGFTLNDAGNMETQIVDFCLNRQENGDKAWAYQFARPLPDDGSHPQDYLKGAFHSSDLWFVFKSLKHCWRPWTQGDWDLSEKMLTAWSNFAKYSDPNGANGGDWKPYTNEDKQFMVFKLNDADVEDSSLGDPLKK